MNASRTMLRGAVRGAMFRRSMPRSMPKRNGSGAAVEYDPNSLDGMVRKFLPQDRHVSERAAPSRRALRAARARRARPATPLSSDE